MKVRDDCTRAPRSEELARALRLLSREEMAKRELSVQAATLDPVVSFYKHVPTKISWNVP